METSWQVLESEVLGLCCLLLARVGPWNWTWCRVGNFSGDSVDDSWKKGQFTRHGDTIWAKLNLIISTKTPFLDIFWLFQSKKTYFSDKILTFTFTDLYSKHPKGFSPRILTLGLERISIGTWMFFLQRWPFHFRRTTFRVVFSSILAPCSTLISSPSEELCQKSTWLNIRPWTLTTLSFVIF